MRRRYLDHWTFSARRSSCTERSESHGTSKKARKANGWRMGKQIQCAVSLLADQTDGLTCTPIDMRTLSLRSFSFTLRKWAPKGLQLFYQQRCCNCGSKGKMSKIETQSRRHKVSAHLSGLVRLTGEDSGPVHGWQTDIVPQEITI